MELKNIIASFILVALLSCISNKHRMEIRPFTVLNKIDTIHNEKGDAVYKFDCFLVTNFKDNKQSERLIDSFVTKNKAADFNSYTQYEMLFYKQSEITNPNHIKENPRDLDRYSQNNDWIYQYTWFNGGNFTRFKIRNGQIIEPSKKVIITDIPDSSKR
jgi:hypothetical protein